MLHLDLPSTPGAFLGYRKDGRPFYLAAGGDETNDAGGEGTPAGGGGTPPSPDPAPAGTGGQPADPGGTDDGQGAPPASGGDGGQDDGKVARTIAAVREEFKGERAKRQAAERDFAQFKADAEQRETARAAAETERNRKLAVALGVAPEDEPPDPAKLAEQMERQAQEHTSALAARDAEIRQRDIRLAVLAQAPGLDANGLLLMDSMSFLGTLSGLDPAAEDFAERVGEAVTAAAAANPQYKLTPAAPPAGGPPVPPVPPRSGGEFNGAPGGNRQWTVEDVEKATAAQVEKAQEQGLLVNLGYSPKRSRR